MFVSGIFGLVDKEWKKRYDWKIENNTFAHLF